MSGTRFASLSIKSSNGKRDESVFTLARYIVIATKQLSFERNRRADWRRNPRKGRKRNFSSGKVGGGREGACRQLPGPEVFLALLTSGSFLRARESPRRDSLRAFRSTTTRTGRGENESVEHVCGISRCYPTQRSNTLARCRRNVFRTAFPM